AATSAFPMPATHSTLSRGTRAMPAPGVPVSLKTVSIAVCSSGMDFGPLLSAPNVSANPVTDYSKVIAIRLIGVDIAQWKHPVDLKSNLARPAGLEPAKRFFPEIRRGR